MKEMRIMRAIGGIDDAYIEEAAPVQIGRAVRFPSWANIALTAAAAVLVVGLGALALYTFNNNIGVDVPGQTTETTVTTTTTEVTTSDEPMVMFSNPFESFDTLEDAAKAAGFGMTIPESFGKYTDRQISVFAGELIQVSYFDKDGNEGLSIRKTLGTDDPSGYYYIFEAVLPITSEGRNGTMSGVTKSDGTVEIYKAIWTDGEYAYSVTAPYDSEDQSGALTGLTQSEMEEIIKNIK